LVEDAVSIWFSGLALVPVANVFPSLAAIGPNIVLNKPGKAGRKGGVELSAVDPAGEVLYHPQAPVLGVAPGAIRMVELVAVQNPGPMEEVVYQAVDRNHVRPHPPVVPPGIAA
jgi:hypothetical protein